MPTQQKLQGDCLLKGDEVARGGVAAVGGLAAAINPRIEKAGWDGLARVLANFKPR